MSSTKIFVVLTRTTSGWVNCWGVDDPSGNRVPMTFASKTEAKEELADHLESATDSGMDYTRRDFKIVEVQDPAEHWDGGE